MHDERGVAFNRILLYGRSVGSAVALRVADVINKGERGKKGKDKSGQKADASGMSKAVGVGECVDRYDCVLFFVSRQSPNPSHPFPQPLFLPALSCSRPSSPSSAASSTHRRISRRPSPRSSPPTICLSAERQRVTWRHHVSSSRLGVTTLFQIVRLNGWKRGWGVF